MASFNKRTLMAALTAGGILLAGAGHAQVFDSGSDGSDGAYAPTMSEVFVVSKATYNFTTINIPAGVTVTFTPDLVDNWPVTWLASGAVNIAGTVDLSGEPGLDGDAVLFTPAQGGPGGWQGGIAARAVASDPDVTLRATGGLGPGGALISSNLDGRGGSGAGYRVEGVSGFAEGAGTRGRAYGNSFLIPLLGGSGGSGAGINSSSFGGSGGAGGGAILIASSDTISVSGALMADGGAGGLGVGSLGRGGGGGSGGAVRLVANEITVSGALSALGGAGGASGGPGGAGSVGRIRLDAFDFNFTGTSTPEISTGPPVLLDVPDSSPRLRIASIGGQNVTDPTGSTSTPDIVITSSDPVTIGLEANNIPVGTTVRVRLMAVNGGPAEAVTLGLAGTLENSSIDVDMTFQAGVTQVIAQAAFTPMRSTRAANGEQVAQVEISTGLDGAQETIYITESGARVPAGASR